MRPVDRAGVRDHGPSQFQGFPYLRTTRLLASFRYETSEAERWSAWIRHMADLDVQARRLELRNLSTAVAGHRKDVLDDKLNSCRERLVATDFTHPEGQARLRDAARVPDDYVDWWRLLGLYPLTAPIVPARVSAWHTEAHDTFARPLASLPVAGRLVRWTSPPAASSVSLPSKKALDARQAGVILHRSLDPLGIPLPAGIDLNRLFETFAPIWEIDVVDENDRIGMMQWENGPVVDTSNTLPQGLACALWRSGFATVQLHCLVSSTLRPQHLRRCGPTASTGE